MNDPRTYSREELEDALKDARSNDVPLWDTRLNPDRYVAGHLSAEMEEDPDNDWEEILD